MIQPTVFEPLRRGGARWAGIVTLLLLVATSRYASAQNCGGIVSLDSNCPAQPPRTSSISHGAQYAITVGANAFLAGFTAGAGEYIRGGSFWRGLARGAAGGGLVFVGKQVSAARFTGAGVLGRQVTAVGGSVVNNAAAGRPLFARLVVPLGPVRLYAEPGSSNPVRLKLDAAGLIAIGYAATRPDARLDVESSLSSGIPVFKVGDEWGHRAAHVAGVILMTDHAIPRQGRLALAHERVHVGQYDFAFLAWSEPVERWAMDRRGIVGQLHRYVDFSANAAVFGALNFIVPAQVSPWEQEAYLLSGTD